MNNISICKLCLQISPLRESHIVPKSLLKFVRDETMNNRFYSINSRSSEIIQDGPKEFLFCEDCEQKISRFEKYYKESIHLSRHNIEILQQGRAAIFRNLDYKKIKLFLLSILWRMSISSLSQFNNVSLADNEEQLRTIMLSENPGNSDEYPTTAIIPLIDNKMIEGLMVFTFVKNLPEGKVYSMVIGGILYAILMSQCGHIDARYLLSESGCWEMQLRDFYKIPFLKNFADRCFSDKIPD